MVSVVPKSLARGTEDRAAAILPAGVVFAQSPAEGIDGGLYIAIAASVRLDSSTVNHVKQNTASKTYKNIFGDYTVVV